MITHPKISNISSLIFSQEAFPPYFMKFCLGQKSQENILKDIVVRGYLCLILILRWYSLPGYGNIFYLKFSKLCQVFSQECVRSWSFQWKSKKRHVYDNCCHHQLWLCLLQTTRVSGSDPYKNHTQGNTHHTGG